MGFDIKQAATWLNEGKSVKRKGSTHNYYLSADATGALKIWDSKANAFAALQTADLLATDWIVGV